MKKLSKNLKYIVFSFFFVAAGFFFTQFAHADTTTPYSCASGGSVIAIVEMTPRGPFPENPTAPLDFIATGQIYSTCSTRMISLTVQNNGDPVETLIASTLINPGSPFPFAPVTRTFPVPASSGGYNLTFKVTVEEPSIPPAPIGHVFAVGPWIHGTHSMAAYEGQPVHPPLTVRVKRFGSQNPYMNTTNPAPGDQDDCILNIPAGTASTPMPQMSSNSCDIGLDGSNYGVVSSDPLYLSYL